MKIIKDLKEENFKLTEQIEFKESQNRVQELLLKSGFNNNSKTKSVLE